MLQGIISVFSSKDQHYEKIKREINEFENQIEPVNNKIKDLEQHIHHLNTQGKSAQNNDNLEQIIQLEEKIQPIVDKINKLEEDPIYSEREEAIGRKIIRRSARQGKRTDPTYTHVGGRKLTKTPVKKLTKTPVKKTNKSYC